MNDKFPQCGHPRTPENSISRTDRGADRCRICKNAYQVKKWAEKYGPEREALRRAHMADSKASFKSHEELMREQRMAQYRKGGSGVIAPVTYRQLLAREGLRKGK